MVALGAMAKLTGVLVIDGIDEILKKFFSPDKHRFIPKNVEAIEAGFNAV
jgi:2-oxoglutarate ferredoxin oxidoreductase subunit gamma